VYLNPRTIPEQMREDWYDHEEYYAYYESGSGTIGYQGNNVSYQLAERLKRIERLMNGKGRLLDVGSGKGHFLAHASKDIYTVHQIVKYPLDHQ